MANGVGYTVIVGVDGSRPSKAALRWAHWHANLARGSVVALYTWEIPVSYPWDVLALDEFHDVARKTLSQAVDEVVGGDTSVDVRQDVLRDHPAKALVDAAQDADLLVVGNRGHGTFTQALLGSVSQYCVHHAPCPVVVVRDHG